MGLNRETQRQREREREREGERERERERDRYIYIWCLGFPRKLRMSIRDSGVPIIRIIAFGVYFGFPLFWKATVS